MSKITLPLSDIYAPIAPGMHRAVAIIDEELQSELPFVNKLCDATKAYRGKMLRPAMLLLTGRALGQVTPQHETLAAVVEIVHMATLVHDDVLDEADVRRRAPTINAMTGNEMAVMLGDYLISHAFHLCSSLDSQYASRLIGHTTNVVCEGELMQIHHRGRYDLTEQTYAEIIRRKTAALTGAACALGAKYAGADVRLTNLAETFGTTAGMAFQVVDDILDLTGTEQSMGKTLGRDLDLAKPTLPFIHYLATASAADGKAIRELASQGSAGARAEVADRLRAAGSVQYALSVAEGYVQEALAAVRHYPDSPATSSLIAMAEFIMQREL